MNKNRLLLLGLLISIAVNLIFVGGISYRVSTFSDERSGRPLPPNVGWVVRDLDEARRDQLEPMLRESFQEIGPIRREMMNAQREVNDFMAAQPFDSAGLNAAFAKLRDASIRYQALSHQQTSEILGLLTEEERLAAMEFVQRRGPRDGRDGFRGRDGGSRFGGPGGRRPPPATATDSDQ